MPLFPATVLVAVDGTEQAARALDAAAELCAATGSTLHLLHVKLTSPILRGRPMSPAQREALEQEGREVLRRSREHAERAGVQVSGEHLRFAPSVGEDLASAQQEMGADLVVVGAARSGTVARRLLSGTGGSDVVRQVPGSVMVIR